MIKTRLVGLLSHAKKYIVYTILWQWAALLSQVIAVFTIADLLERVVYGAVTATAVKRTVFMLAIVVVIRFFCERMGARSSYLACVDVKRILREKIYEKMLKLGASYSEQVSSSEVVQVSTEGVEQLETYFGKYLPQLFYSLIAPLTLFAILCRVSMKASVILLICVPLIPISIVVVQKIAKKLLNKYWSIYTGLGDSFLENLLCAVDDLAFRAVKSPLKRPVRLFAGGVMPIAAIVLIAPTAFSTIAFGRIFASSEFFPDSILFRASNRCFTGRFVHSVIPRPFKLSGINTAIALRL